MKANKGYTLVEMIIVMAIIAILSGLSFITLGVINRAKCDTAADSINNQMASLLVKTKAISQAKNERLCMIIKKNTSCSTGAQTNVGTYSIILGTDSAGDGTGFVEKEAGVTEATLAKVVEKIVYTEADSTQKSTCIGTSITNNNFDKAEGGTLSGDIIAYIEFNKSNGSVVKGAGRYDLYYQNEIIATVYLDKDTGNHYIK